MKNNRVAMRTQEIARAKRCSGWEEGGKTSTGRFWARCTRLEISFRKSPLVIYAEALDCMKEIRNDSPLVHVVLPHVNVCL